MFGRHDVIAFGVRNDNNEFARCRRCHCDLVRAGSGWKPVPKGFRVVWRPRTGDAVADQMAGAAAVGKQVDLRGVTVVGERVHDSQRFALVILNPNDRRDYVSADKLGKSGPLAVQMKRALEGAGSNSSERGKKPFGERRLAGKTNGAGQFDWEQTYTSRKRLT